MINLIIHNDGLPRPALCLPEEVLPYQSVDLHTTAIRLQEAICPPIKTVVGLALFYALDLGSNLNRPVIVDTTPSDVCKSSYHY